MIKLIACFILALHMHFAYAQDQEGPIPNPSVIRSSNRPKSSDPVQTFLSGLGNLFMDMDEVFTRQVAPKVNAEDGMYERLYGRPRSGPSYFNRVRENYRDIQRRLGESLGILDLSMSSDLGSVNVQNQGPKSAIDVSFPFLPMEITVKSNRVVNPSDNVNNILKDKNIKPEQVSPHFTSSFKLGNTEIKMDSKLNPLQPSELNVENQFRKVLEDARLPNGKVDGSLTEDNAQEKKAGTIPPLESELNLNSNKFSSRSGRESESSEPLQDHSSPEGRILGDALYSESTFDDLTKRVMKSTKWVMDPKVFPSKVVEKLKKISDRATENSANANIDQSQAQDTTKDTTLSEIPQLQKQEKMKEDFRKRKSLKPLSNSLNTISFDEKLNVPKQDVNFKQSKEDSKYLKDSIILAFTPEGVALKLRMGPEIVNPLKFLHKSLRTYGVSLNIPIASYDNLKPVGSEIFQLGAGSGGIVTRALYIDLSDSFQLESLLRTLKRSKMLQELENEGTDDQEIFGKEI